MVRGITPSFCSSDGATPPSWLHQRQQQVFAVDRRVAVLFREALRLLQGFLRLNRQFVESHRRPSKLSMVLSSRLTSTL
jgi:hypothetical protein